MTMAVSTLMVLYATTLALPVFSGSESSSLSLRDMCITAIIEKHFSSYSHVIELDLSGNAISYIHPQGFCGMKSLFKLDLSDNRISYINPNTFKCTPKLRRLNLKHNEKLGIGINHVFLHSSSIALLDISYCNFKQFSNHMFSFMASLKTVIALSNPACQNFKAQFDHFHLECGVPRHLDLSISNGNKGVNKTPVSVTQVSTPPIEQQATSDLNIIEHNYNSSTNHNNVSKLEGTAVFSNETEHQEINNSPERKTKEVTEANIQPSDDGEVFPQNHHGMKVDSEPSAKNEEGPPDLFKTNVQDAKYQGESKEPEKKKSNAPLDTDLEKYRKDIKRMHEIPEYYFIGMENVLSLDLSGLNIIYIHRMALCGLDSLRKLSLSSNNLRYLHPDTFLCTPNLQALELKQNSQLDLNSQNIFLKSESIKYLDVSFCNFATLPKDMLSQMPNLIFVNAFGNSGCPQIASQFKRLRHVPCLEKKGNEYSAREGTLNPSDCVDQFDRECVTNLRWTVIGLSVLIMFVLTGLVVIWKFRKTILSHIAYQEMPQRHTTKSCSALYTGSYSDTATC